VRCVVIWGGLLRDLGGGSLSERLAAVLFHGGHAEGLHAEWTVGGIVGKPLAVFVTGGVDLIVDDVFIQ
jgi:hypothetical protein